MKNQRRSLTRLSSMLLGLGVLSGCANLAPAYVQPAAPLAQVWQSAAVQGATDTANAAETAWQTFFTDEKLRALIGLTLANNRDLQIAALNIERARAQYGIARSAAFPEVDLGASASRSRGGGPASAGGQSRVSSQYSVDLGLLSYELDFFGRVRNLGEVARQSYFSSAENRRSSQISLVAEVSTAWLVLAADMQRLELARNTLQSQQKSFDLIERSYALGAQSGLALAQARGTVEAARVEVAFYDSQVEQDRNALNLLAGTAVPMAMLPQNTLETMPISRLLAPPAGLPSSVLQQRPDVLAAEYALRASHADIGAARAAFYPRIALTGSVGSASSSLSGLFGAGSGVWSFSPSISLPIFNAGANRANLRVTQVQQKVQLATYEKTLQTAFREVADALAARRTLSERLAAQQALVTATARSLELSDALFKSGAGAYLDVLDAQRSLYSVQQTLINTQLTEQVNRITLYKALGGGWNEPTAGEGISGAEIKPEDQVATLPQAS